MNEFLKPETYSHAMLASKTQLTQKFTGAISKSLPTMEKMSASIKALGLGKWQIREILQTATNFRLEQSCLVRAESTNATSSSPSHISFLCKTLLSTNFGRDDNLVTSYIHCNKGAGARQNSTNPQADRLSKYESAKVTVCTRRT